MSVETFFHALTHDEKLKVLELTLPGIEVFLKDVLSQEGLSEAGENLRVNYVRLLENSKTCGSKVGQSDEFLNLKGTELSPLETPPFHVSRFIFESEASSGVNRDVQIESDALSKENPQEKVSKGPKPRRKGTDSTEESGVFVSTQSSNSDGLNVTNPQHLDASETSSRETFVSDSEFEFLEWETDINLNEDGYCTGDNIESYLENVRIQPNEYGELYMGVIYVREQPGWHKRWFTITERCLKCFKHRTENKMLFEIPLQNAKIIPTERKRSRMFPITLSIPRLKDAITFATTEEQSRQEWIYVINHVIGRLAEEGPFQDNTDSERKISLSTLMRSGNADEMRNSYSSRERINATSDANSAASEMSNERDDNLRMDRKDGQSANEKRRTWHAGSREAGREGALNQWRIEVTEGDELPDMDSSLSPILAEEESFKELQECLPDILQRPKTLSGNRRKRVGIINLTSSSTDHTTSGSKGGSPSRKNLTFSPDVESKVWSTPDLSVHPRVKRHGSLANSLSSKAARVKSKLASSFFKKGTKRGKRDDRTERHFGSQSTTLSGYLSRKKGHAWKSRWCVITEHSLYCYKDFGVGIAELELTLGGCEVNAVPEGEGEKPFMFVLTADKEELHFAAENDAELEEWIMVLESEAKGFASSNEQVSLSSPEAIDGYMMTTLSSPDSPLALHNNSESTMSDVRKESHTSPKTRKEKPAQGPVKRTSVLGALAHKFGKSKAKHSSEPKATPTEQHSPTQGVQDECVMVRHGDQGVTTRDDVKILDEGPRMDGFMYHWVEQTWLRFWVRLYHHTLYIHEDKDNELSVVLKFRLINCVVLDCADTQGPSVMAIKKSTGQPLYLKAETESDYVAWKESISSAILTSPSTTKRLMSNESSTDVEETHKVFVPARVKISGDSFDSVFGRDDVDGTDASMLGRLYSSSSPSSPSSPFDAYPSPRASTAGDVSSAAESEDECNRTSDILIRRSHSAGGIDRLRSRSEGHLSQNGKRGSPLRRTISNALASLDLSPKKRRSKTFAGLGVAASLLIGIKHTSCLYLRDSKGRWSKRWCVLQQNKLHFFNSGDDLSPTLTLPLSGCKARKINKKGKQFTFELKIPSESVECCLAAENEKELLKWIDLLKGEASGERIITQKGSCGLDLLNGLMPQLIGDNPVEESMPDVALASEMADAANNNANVTNTCSKSTSLMELRRIRESVPSDHGDLIKSASHESSPTLNQTKATSLQEVLRLLQEQQLLQNLGQTRYIRVKKARVNWKRSAAAALKDNNSQPESPELEKKKEDETKEEKDRKTGVEKHGKARTASIVSYSSVSNECDEVLSTCRSPVKDTLNKFEKLAEEEKVKAIKTETLLRKRRNSLNLEKEVLEKKIVKNQEKKGTVKKLLGKETVVDKGELVRAQKKLEEVNLKLANVDQDIEQNKTKEAEIMGSINAMKTRSVRSFSGSGDSLPYRGTPEERRTRFKNSSEGSTSSRESIDDKIETHRNSSTSLQSSRSASLHRKGSKKQCQASLIALEEELKKISPAGARRTAGRKRLSVSSEGSVDENSIRGSPATSRRNALWLNQEKRDSTSSEGSTHAYDRPSSASSESAEARRRKHSFSSSSSYRGEVHNMAVDIPTRKGLSIGTEEASSLPIGGEHRPSLITALSQIKDFEEFLASTKQ